MIYVCSARTIEKGNNNGIGMRGVIINLARKGPVLIES